MGLKSISRLLNNRLNKLGDHLYGPIERNLLETMKKADDRRLPNWRQLKLLPKIFTAREQRAALSLLLLCLISGLILGWRTYARQTILVPASGGQYNEGLIGYPRTTNPLLSSSEAELDLSKLTYRGLFKYSGQGQLEPDLADSWSLSADKTTYQIKLKNNLFWSDGQSITNEDVYFTYLSVQDKTLNSPRGGSFQNVEINLTEDGLINFKLKEPYQPFLDALTLGIIPVHLWQNIAPERWLLAEANLKPIGSGPWRFKSLVKDKQGNLLNYRLEANPYTHTKQPYLKEINLNFYGDLTAAAEALRQGDIDGLGGLTWQTNNLSQQKYQILDITLPHYNAIFLNPQQHSLLKDKNVRLALAYGTNRSAIIQETLGSQAVPSHGPFSYGELKMLTAQSNTNYNETKAQELLAKAGLTKDTDSGLYKTKDNKELALTLTVIDQEEDIKVAEAIKQQWEKLGLLVSLDIIPAWRLQKDIINTRNYQALLAGEIMGLDPDPYPFWHSSQISSPGLNLALWQNRTADQLLNQARQTFDKAEQNKLYVQFQNILSEEMPAVFLYSKNYHYIIGKKLKGLDIQLLSQPADRFNQSENWYAKTDRQ
ncbi:MAG: peptide ABC transporter substrate-binding protein [Patescibacteria group bacterium]